MDLALAFGSTVDELENRMTVPEWDLWRRYHARFGLPWRRIEMHLAQCALVTGLAGGIIDRTTPVSRFLLDPEPIRPVSEVSGAAADAGEDAEDDAADAFGALPVEGTRPRDKGRS